MSRYTTVYKEIEVDIDLEDFDDSDILEEMELRGLAVGASGDGRELLTAIWIKRRQGQDYQTELDQLIYAGLGKII
jgi:hypothetical protein